MTEMLIASAVAVGACVYWTWLITAAIATHSSFTLVFVLLSFVVFSAIVLRP